MQLTSNLLQFDPKPDIRRPLDDPAPSWELTRAIHLLRLTIADACLRAREEARQFHRNQPEYWTALGNAHGYQIATTILRGWIAPDKSVACIESLAEQLHIAQQSQRRHLSHTKSSQVFYDAYAWTLGWVMMQIHELD